MIDTTHSGVLGGVRPTVEGLASRARIEWGTGFAAAVAMAGLAGFASAAIIPRGPTTELQGLAVMAIGFLLGAVTGLLTGRARLIVVVGLVHLGAIELGRIDAVGPTVDMIRLDNSFGLIAFAVGRGLHGLLLLMPMMFGLALGLRARAGGKVGRRPIGPALLGLATAGLAVLVALPGSTPPVLGVDGQPIPGSIAELTTVELGGQEQSIMIRAANPDNPVLLYLSGGPGQSDLGYSRAVTTTWVQDFVFVDYDQRGNGTSYPAFEPATTLTGEQAVADTIALTEYLIERFDEDKIYIMGESWGTILGTLAAAERPDLYHAYLGSGQMVNIRETDRRIYEDLQAYAERTNDQALAATLDGFGAPPYRDFPWTNATIWQYYDYIYSPYTPSQPYLDRMEAGGVGPYGVLATEYGLIDKANALRGLFDVFTILYPDVYDIDLRREAPRLEVPVYVLDGAAELEGRRALALEWFDALAAPSKQLVTYENAAHSTAFEQIDEVHRLLTETVVPATYGR